MARTVDRHAAQVQQYEFDATERNSSRASMEEAAGGRTCNFMDYRSIIWCLLVARLSRCGMRRISPKINSARISSVISGGCPHEEIGCCGCYERDNTAASAKQMAKAANEQTIWPCTTKTSAADDYWSPRQPLGSIIIDVSRTAETSKFGIGPADAPL